MSRKEKTKKVTNVEDEKTCHEKTDKKNTSHEIKNCLLANVRKIVPMQTKQHSEHKIDGQVLLCKLFQEIEAGV